MTLESYCDMLAVEHGVHARTIARRIRSGVLPSPPIHKINGRAYHVAVEGFPCDTVPLLKAKVEAYKIALADAIRRPMGVVPDSAEKLITLQELTDAERRRAHDTLNPSI